MGPSGNRSYWLLTILCFGIAFLYVPLLSIIVYSFNDSQIISVWNGASLRWYREVLSNRQALEALWLSVRIAVVSATFATLLGFLAGLSLQRFASFRGRFAFTGIITAPLVMPEVITGLSLLLLFIVMDEFLGWPSGRGVTTVTIAHITFSMAYVAVIVRARLAGMDESLEEAAQDLGAKPIRVLFDITAPLVAPGLVAGWLLAFTLSFDDLVISSFVSGPGSTTLPIYIYSSVRLGVKPDINALATIIIAIVTVCVVIAGIVMARSERRRQRDATLAERG